MKVTVCFENVKVVVPCGEGDMLIRDLASMALVRYQKSMASNSQSRTPNKSGSPSTKLTVMETRSSTGSGQNNSSAATGSDVIRASEGALLEVGALTLARDGGILDWDDRVVDVLDDREMLIAHFHTNRSKPAIDTEQSSSSLFGPNTVQYMSTSVTNPISSDVIPVRCNGGNDHYQPESQKTQTNVQIQHPNRHAISDTSFASCPNITEKERSSNRKSIELDEARPNPVQVKEIIKQLNFEARAPSLADISSTLIKPEDSTPQPKSNSQAAPPPPPPLPLRHHKDGFQDPVENEQYQKGSVWPEAPSTENVSTFKGSAFNTGLRGNRPAPPPPPPPHAKMFTCPELRQYGDQYPVHPGGLLAHVADTMCPTGLSGEQLNQRYSEIDTPTSSSSMECRPPVVTGSTGRTNESSPSAALPPPLQLPYPPGSLLPALPFPSVVCTASTNSTYLNENPLSLMDSSTLSTVPEEEFDAIGSTSDQSTPSQSLPTVQSRVVADFTSQSDRHSSDTTTRTLSSVRSNSVQGLSHSESDDSKVTCSVINLVDSNASPGESKLPNVSPAVATSPPHPPPIPPPVTTLLTPRTNTETTVCAATVPPAPQATSSSAHDRSIPTGGRTGRKMKRRRVPRPPPPPPPPVPPYRELDSPESVSGSDSDNNEPLLMETIPGQETHTICRRPLITGSIPTSRTDVPLNAKVQGASTTTVTDTETLEHALGVNLDLRGLSHPASSSTNVCGYGADINATMTSTPATPLSAHWSNPTDCVPGYTPEELAEAEHSLQQLQTSQHQDSHHERERQFSLDEERSLLMKPAPPKRSPLTTLTGLSLLTQPNHLPASTGCRGAGVGRNFSGGNSGQFRDAGGGSTSSRDDVDGLCEDFQSARSSDTNHDLDENRDDDDEDDHDTSSLTGDELVDEQQRRAAAAEDEVLHMTELLSKRRESEARRHLMMAEMEADMERDHRLRAAATAMALAAVSNLSPSRKARVHRYHTHSGRCSRHNRHGAQSTSSKTPLFPADPYVHRSPAAFREEDMLISITKTPAGLGFSLTTKPLKPAEAGMKVTTGDAPGEELGAICVKNILPGGAALKEGQLRLGDRLLQVDDQDVSNKTQAEIVSILRVKPVGSVVRLLVRRQVPLDASTLPRPVPIGLACPGCLALKSAGVKPCSDYLPYGSVTLNNLNPIRHPLQPMQPQPHTQPSSQQQKQKHHRQKLIDELTHRNHPQYPVCHKLQASKLSSSTASGCPERTVYRCASPPLPQRTLPLLDDLPDVTSTTNYPPYPDVLIFRLNIPLVCKSTPAGAATSSNPTATASSEACAVSTTVGSDATTANTASTGAPVSRHMRLGVSVRETCSSRASKLAERSRSDAEPNGDKLSRGPFTLGDEQWMRDLGADSVYGGVLVKGIIEGGAAHQDGRLRVGDELLEVNGVPLVNASSPLGLLRSVLRQLTSPPPSTQTPNLQQKSDLDESIIQVSQTSSQPAAAAVAVEHLSLGGALSKTVPTVELLTARQMRHRRSASGHTLSSNSEFWTETYPSSTVTTPTTMCQTSAVSGGPLCPGLHSSASGNSPRLVSGHGMEGDSRCDAVHSSIHAMQIEADVHSHRWSIAEESNSRKPDSAANPSGCEMIPQGTGKSAMEATVKKSPMTTATSTKIPTIGSDAPVRSKKPT